MQQLVKTWLGAALLTVACSASAVTLSVGVLTALPGTTVALEPQLAGLVLEDEIQAFSFAANGGTISGSVQSRVVRSTLDGTLDFYWRFISDANSSGAIGSFRVGDFFTSTYNANWRIDGLGDTSPESAYLFPGGLGQVNFEFGRAGAAAGSESFFLLLDTDETMYSRSAVYDLTNVGQSEISQLYSTFAPGQVPEPGSMAIFGIGLAGFMLARRRK
jgi:hypothetical protein